MFASDDFWAALNRLADRRGHDGHDRYLAGQAEQTDRYALRCTTCRQVVATMRVDREERLDPRVTGPRSPSRTCPRLR